MLVAGKCHKAVEDLENMNARSTKRSTCKGYNIEVDSIKGSLGLLRLLYGFPYVLSSAAINKDHLP